MSASAPKLQPPESREERESKAPWVALAVLFHVLLLGWLIYFVPVRELVSLSESGPAIPPPAANAASPEMVREVSQQIETTQAEEARSKVEEMQTTEKMLAELQAQKESEFSALARELSADAPRLAAEAQTAAAQAQAEAEQAQTEAARLAADLKKLGDTSPAENPSPDPATGLRDKVAEAQEKAKIAQAKASAAQTTALQQLEFREDESFKAAKLAQEEAVSAQAQANQKQDEATAKIAAINSQQRAVHQAAENAGKLQQQAATQQTRSDQLKEGIAKQEEALQQQKNSLENLQQKPDATKGPIAKEIAKTNAAINSFTAKLNNAKSDLEKTQAKVAEIQAKADAAKAEIDRLKTTAAEVPEQARAAQEEALQAQQKASAVQARAQTMVAQVNSSNPTEASSPAPSAPEKQSPAPALEGKSFAELYNTAVQTEKEIAEKFQNIRATQVAVQRKIPISEARKYVEVATPVRAAFEGGRPDSIADATALEKQNAAIENANQQLDSMVALSRSMAFQANNSGGGPSSQGVDVSLAGMKADAEQADQLAEMATETGDGQNAVDLTGIMREIENGTDAPTAAENQKQADGQNSTKEAEGKGSTEGTDQGLAQGNGKAGNRGKLPPGAGQSPPPMGDVKESVPGRKVHATSYANGDRWMFLDTWYIIGPFPNPQRRNLETKFPPESIVDLDATYQVDGGKLRWQFVQTSTAAIHPPLEQSYAIYYAYTTLWFDEPMDLWTATGSDDFSKVWVNDLLVWASGPIQKIWRPDEGYRKVHFKKGLNRVLVRLENGHNACMFSFMLNMQTVKNNE